LNEGISLLINPYFRRGRFVETAGNVTTETAA